MTSFVELMSLRVRWFANSSSNLDFHFLKFLPVQCLPSNPKFHPKRNTALMKLATLSESRMRDLCGDVHHELARRYPEFYSDSIGMRALHVSFDAPLLEQDTVSGMED